MKSKHKRNIRTSLIACAVLFLAVISLLIYNSIAPTGDIVMYETRSGGMCVDGPCYTSTPLYANGHFGDKRLSRSQVKNIKKLISQTDFSRYEPNINGFCQSYVDGSDVGYKFPTKTGEQIFTLCRLSIPDDDPLFTYLKTLSSNLL